MIVVLGHSFLRQWQRNNLQPNEPEEQNVILDLQNAISDLHMY